MVTTVRRKIKGQYDSIADAKADRTLRIGDTAKTSGYSSLGDGGDGQYIVVAGATGVDDGGSYHNMINGHQLKLIVSDGTVRVRQFGAKLDGTTNDGPSVNNAASFCSTERHVLDLENGELGTAETIELDSLLPVISGGRSEIKLSTGATKDFDLVRISTGNGVRKEFGTINGGDRGLVLQGNISDIYFRRIQNCNQGLVILAETANNLDNEVRGIQIALCNDAIVFEQNGKRTQQGNKIEINFVAECQNTLVFDDNGTHTEQSAWDGNHVILEASDPLSISDASIFLNRSTYSVPQLKYHINSWVGGWTVGGGTMVMVRGRVSACNFLFRSATRITSAEWADSLAQGGLDSCIISLPQKANIGAGTYINASNTQGLTNFNGGEALDRAQYSIRITTPADIVVGEATTAFLYHILSKTANSKFFTGVANGLNSGRFSLALQPAGNIEDGELQIHYRNISNATILAGSTIDLTLYCGDL